MKFAMKWKVVPYVSSDNKETGNDLENKLSLVLRNKNLSNEEIVNYYNKALADHKSTTPSNPAANAIAKESVIRTSDFSKHFNDQYEILEYIQNSISNLKEDIIEELTKQNRIVAKPQPRKRPDFELNKSVFNPTKKALRQLQQSSNNPLINNDKPPAHSTRNKTKSQQIDPTSYRIKKVDQEASDQSDMETSQIGRNHWIAYK